MKAFGYVLTLLLWVWTVIKFALDWIGRTTVTEDFSTLLGRLPDWSTPLIATPTWIPAICAIVLTGGTLWLMWRIQEPVSDRLQHTVKQRRTVSAKAKGNIETSVDTDHDFDLILRPEDPVMAHGHRTDDGIDVLVRLVIRNRSTTPLWIDVIGQFKMTLGDREGDNPSGGISRPMRKESNQTSQLGALRIFDDLEGKSGNGRISYLFGKTEDSARSILDVDVDFTILETPKTKGTQERVSLEVTANRSSYRIKTDENL